MKPMRLTEAAKLYGVTAASLRKEAANGRLVIWRFAGKDWTTPEEIDRMFERCRLDQKAPVYGSGQNAGTPAAHLSSDHHGSSETTEPNRSALAAALMTVQALKQNLRNTSRENMRRSALNAQSRK